MANRPPALSSSEYVIALVVASASLAKAVIPTTVPVAAFLPQRPLTLSCVHIAHQPLTMTFCVLRKINATATKRIVQAWQRRRPSSLFTDRCLFAPVIRAIRGRRYSEFQSMLRLFIPILAAALATSSAVFAQSIVIPLQRNSSNISSATHYFLLFGRSDTGSYTVA